MTLPAAPPVAVGLVAGWVADQLLGDPRRGHPVALLGSWADWVEARTHADSRAAGIATEAIVLAPVLALGVAAGRLPAPARGGATAALVWAALGGTSLGREGTAVHDLLVDGDLPGARARLRHLVGRVTDDLTADEVARAAVESVAENSSDAVVGTLVWGALLGPLGVVLHRAANTLDAMHGHRTQRYARFGWAAARLDDALGWLPARVTVLATAAAVPLRAGAVVGTAFRDGKDHPSPNAGPVEAGFAAALGIRLGGRTVYASGVEERPALGHGRPVTVADLPRAVRLARRVGAITLAAVVAVAVPGIRLRSG
ncbi:adenosylcobinamide-phosphate synthase CbiB [Janibacter cremeus]|uniref:adenosylcobinamide-phosphate synthase CbiB n=1 Tax=Janibacter cremeus TaxID=1285192 RepID=UPI0023F72F92|nr:adenosylcobinamide-phosphate synthase CbiB [Janibacter cremeus]WEV78536.1 adenosylcobinamide-phosphate synthase CbiB [Janibacter cremeus]